MTVLWTVRAAEDRARSSRENEPLMVHQKTGTPQRVPVFRLLRQGLEGEAGVKESPLDCPLRKMYFRTESAVLSRHAAEGDSPIDAL